MIALSQKGNTCIQVIFTQSSVSMTTTSEYLPVSGFNVPSLHLPQSSRLHPFQVSQKQTATVQATKVIPDLPATLSNCASSRQKTWKQTHNKSFLFRFKSHKTVSTSYTVQAVSNESIHAPFKRIHNCNSKPRMLPDASENQNQRSQTGKHSLLCPFLLTVRFQPTISTPSSIVPSVPWRFLLSSLSLSALQCLTARQTPNCFRLQFQGHQCKRPSSPTVPAHYRTSGVQLLTSYFQTTQISHLTHAAIQFSHEPRSLTKQNLTLQVPMPQFLFLTTTSRHDARLSSTTHCALRASRINYNLTNLSRCTPFLMVLFCFPFNAF